MTPDEISAIVDRMDDHARAFDRKNGTFRQFGREQAEIAKPLLEYADSGAENWKLASEAYHFACAGADADGLYLQVEDDLTLDHTPSDQQAYLRRLYSLSPPDGEMSPIELLAETRRLGQELTEWIDRFNYRGKTYRDFWEEHAAAAADFEALLRRPDLPAAAREYAALVHDAPLHRGFDPAGHIPPKGLDDAIYDPAAAR